MAENTNGDEKLLCKKFKSIESLEKAYLDLAKKFGAHGREIGALKKRCAHLEAQLTRLKI